MPYTQQQITNVGRTYRHYRDVFGERDWITRNAIDTLRRYNVESRWAAEVALHPEDRILCENCGEVVGFVEDGETVYSSTHEIVEIDGDCYCCRDCAEEHGWAECEHCGEWHAREDSVEACDRLFCSESCAEHDGYFRCEHCEEWAYRGDSVWVNTYSGGERWCESCWDEDARTCDCCGGTFDMDDMCRNDYDGWYCEDCHERGCEDIPSWGCLPRIKMHDVTGQLPGPHLGTELETDGSDRYEYVSDLDSIDGFRELFWMGDDGSLSDDGVEIKTQPMTLAKHESIRCIYDKIGEIARKYGYTSHDNGRCGIHISVNREWFGKSEVVQDAHILKFMRLLQRFEHQFTTFSRRQDDRWCRYGTARSYAPEKGKVNVKTPNRGDELLGKAKAFKESERDKYQALNIRHSSHIEIRIFRGTLKWSTYFASLALVDGLSRVVKLHGSRWIEDVSWYDLIDEVVELVKAGGNEFSAQCLESYLDEKSLR